MSCLREGEVFCRYQKDEQSEAVIVTGEVLVCRAPALHPGDVRRAQAVDRPQLRHLKNVVVFSTQGKRPLPNMLGGGDLDGDGTYTFPAALTQDYPLIWDQRFVRPLTEQPAMDYTALKPVRVPEVTQARVNENFVNYIMVNTHGIRGYADCAECQLGKSTMRTSPGRHGTHRSTGIVSCYRRSTV